MNWSTASSEKDLTSPEEPWMELHEVYYDNRGRITSWTQYPVEVNGASKAEVERMLLMMRRDLRKPIVLESDLAKMLNRRKVRTKA